MKRIEDLSIKELDQRTSALTGLCNWGKPIEEDLTEKEKFVRRQWYKLENIKKRKLIWLGGH